MMPRTDSQPSGFSATKPRGSLTGSYRVLGPYTEHGRFTTCAFDRKASCIITFFLPLCPFTPVGSYLTGMKCAMMKSDTHPSRITQDQKSYRALGNWNHPGYQLSCTSISSPTQAIAPTRQCSSGVIVIIVLSLS